MSRMLGLISSRVFLLVVTTLLFAAPLAAQDRGTIRGTVRGEDNVPLAGAQVSVEGLRVGTVTNADGRFVIPNVPVGTHTLVVTIIGFGEQRRQVTVSTTQVAAMDFRLRQQALSMSEIVVTGVTEATSRARLPFTVAKVTKEMMPVTPRTAEAAIQGKISGATVVQSPQPGEAAAILLRTPTSIHRNTAPLIVVDGTILTASSVDVSSLDIESVEVIKGAAAASLYGSRAGAGVIQIRTTRGSSIPENRTLLSVRSEFGSSDVLHPIEWARRHPFRMNANGEFLNAQNQVVTSRTQAAFKPVPFQDAEYPGVIYDHVKSLFDPGATLTNHVSLGYNGGNTSWLASGSLHSTQGVTREIEGYRRADFRVNLDHRIANRLSFSASLFHLRSKQDDVFGGNDAFFDFVQIAPDVDLLQPDPDGTRYHFQPDDAGIRPNPLYGLATQTHEDKRQRTLASLDLRYNPLSWVALDINGSYDRSDRNSTDYVPKGVKTANYPTGDPGSLDRTNLITNGLNASAGISVSRDFNKVRMRTVLRGLIERQDRDDVIAHGTGFSVGGLPDLDAANTSDVESLSENVRSSGYLINTEADYDDKYIFSGLVRRDGSSLFGPEERWHTYYRVSGAYRMAAERWWPIAAINEFKLRYSRGTAGGRPNFADRFEVFQLQEGGGLSLLSLGNPFLKPEKTTENEMGVDVVAFNRLSLQLTYAQQRTVDQLLQVPLPRIYGFGTRWENAGTIEGKTLEGTLEARVIDKGSVRWSINVIADRSRNKIVEYNRPCHTDDFGWRCTGETLGMLYGEKFVTSATELPAAAQSAADQFQVNDDGLLVWVGAGNSYRDGVAKNLWNTTTSIGGTTYTWGIPFRLRDANNQVTRVKIGDSNPDLTWGIGNSLQWNRLNLYALVGGQIGGDVYNDTKQRMYQHQRHREEDQDGKPDELKKPITYYTPTLYNAANNVSWFIEDGTFIKLREVALRYSLDDEGFRPLRRFGVQRAVVSLIGRNLALWTDYSGYDPEIVDDTEGGAIAERVDSFTFPSYRTFTFGIELVF